jgi:hypothetical protein
MLNPFLCTANTPALCITECQTTGSLFAAVAKGACQCGDVFNSKNPANGTPYQAAACPGNSGVTCGMSQGNRVAWQVFYDARAVSSDRNFLSDLPDLWTPQIEDTAYMSQSTHLLLAPVHP